MDSAIKNFYENGYNSSKYIEEELNIYINKQIIKSKSFNDKKIIAENFLKNLLHINNINFDISNEILELAKLLLPGQTKACYAKHLNKIIENKLKIDLPTYITINTETPSPFLENCDIKLLNIKSNHDIYLFIQRDLWSGGEQLNRGDKYVICDKKNIISVVCAKPKLYKKSIKIFENGFNNKNLCYYSQIVDILKIKNFL